MVVFPVESVKKAQLHAKQLNDLLQTKQLGTARVGGKTWEPQATPRQQFGLWSLHSAYAKTNDSRKITKITIMISLSRGIQAKHWSM